MPSDSEGSLSEEEDATYEVERILAQEVNDDGPTLYLVKWRGYPEEQCTWEPAEHFSTPDTLSEWKRQYDIGDFLDDEQVKALQARMNEWALARQKQEQEQQESEEESPPARLQGSSRVPRIPQPRRTSSASTEHGSKRPRPQDPSISNPQASDRQAGSLVSRTQSSFQKKGTATVVKKSSARSTTHPALAGMRFKNLKHQNNFAKRARQEPAPDISKLDLKAPDDFLRSSPAIAKAQEATHNHRDDSPLFMPEMTPVPGDGVGSRSLTSNPVPSVEPPLDRPTEPAPVIPMKPALGRLAQPAPTRPTEPTPIHPTEPAPIHSTKPTPVRPTEPAPLRPTKPPLERPTEPVPIPSTEAPPEQPKYMSFQPPFIPHPTRQNEPAKARSGLSRSISQPRGTPQSDMARRNSSYTPLEHPDGDRSSRDRGRSDSRPDVVARNGRAWNRGEVVVHLSYCNHPVGDVKILHFPGWLISRTISLKAPGDHTVNIHFQERYVMKRGEFTQFMLNLERSTIALGAIEPYEDTREPIASLAEHLETNNMGAVWESDTGGYVMVLYSCKAPGWSGHGQRPISGSESRLHVMVRNKLPGFYVEDWVSQQEVATQSKDSTAEADIGGAPNDSIMKDTTTRTRDPAFQRDTLQRLVTERNAMSKHLGAYVGSPSETQTMNKDRSNPTRSPVTPITPGSPSQQNSPLREDSTDQVAIGPSVQTKLTFSATFKQLVNLEREKKRPIFYIAFAQSHPAEAQTITKWLTEEESVSMRHIYADTEKTAWAEMREEINTSNTKCGVVLFLKGTQAYCDLKSFAKWVRQLACFSLFLPQSSISLDSSISKLFPRGMVLFITEYTMMEFPEEVSFALRWFEEQSRGKENARKLGLVPNVKEWILRRLLICDKNSQESYIGMLEVIHRLKTQASNAWNNSPRAADPDRYIAGEKPGQEDGVLLTVPQLPGYADIGSLTMDTKKVAERDRILIQYFCGWAALRVDKYKGFDLLDEQQTNELTPHSWHVAFRKPMAFVESLKRTS